MAVSASRAGFLALCSGFTVAETMGRDMLPLEERGAGMPLVVVPGIQGRWEYLAPAIDALAVHFRVITFALAGERASGMAFAASRGFDNYADQIAAALDARQIERASVCGVSFGGVAALRFAASHPERTAALVLVSTPGPRWRLRLRHERYLDHPYVFGPLFVVETPFRLRPELEASFPRIADRVRFSWSQLKALAAAPVSLARMAERGRLLSRLDTTADCARVSAPALVVTGEPSLDYVVPALGSSEYARLIPSARAIVLARTGHLGCITRPADFAGAVHAFVKRPGCEHAA
jgi:pimeloyl-ACP methyl ester carboxylesterase